MDAYTAAKLSSPVSSIEYLDYEKLVCEAIMQIHVDNHGIKTNSDISSLHANTTCSPYPSSLLKYCTVLHTNEEDLLRTSFLKWQHMMVA